MPSSIILLLSRALTVVSILIACSSAQKCYYPDGSAALNHTACASSGADSACCASKAFCLDNGLCFQGGIVTRGSCTDKTWDSKACAGYCKQEKRGGSIAITPCKDDGGKSTFVCGLNNMRCKNESQTFGLMGSSTLVLRPAQVSDLAAPLLSRVAAQASASAASVMSRKTATSSAQPQATPAGLYYTQNQMAGLGLGLGIPLLIAACTAFMLWSKERARHPKLMYQLPDEDIMDLKPPPSNMFPAHPAIRSSPGGYFASSMTDLASFRTATPTYGRETPPHMQTFADPYRVTKQHIYGTSLPEQDSFELDGQPVGSAFRFTTADKPAEKEKSVTATTIELGNRTTTTTNKLPRDRDRERTR